MTRARAAAAKSIKNAAAHPKNLPNKPPKTPNNL